MATMQARIAELSRRQIAEFFSDNASTTQEQCNQTAEQILGRRVRPAPVQGSTSYTVVPDDDAGECVVQYRASDSSLDLDFLRCIEQTYGRFMPRHWDSGSLGKLHIYTMGNVGGVSVYLALDQLHGNHCYLLRQTLQDFASFFASAWHNTPASMVSPSRKELYSDYSSRLSQLSRGLPERFRPTLKRLISNLPGLFAEDWPLVPNHTDLLENNIHVHRETGSITGICDWKDTTIGPFGTSLGGLETLLGIRTREDGWRYHANQGELRDLFWEAFYSAMGPVSPEQKDRIEDARLVGIFLDNGFVYVNAEDQVPVSEGSFNLNRSLSSDHPATGLTHPEKYRGMLKVTSYVGWTETESVCPKLAYLTTPSNKGWTPMHSASSNGHEAVVRLLVEKGAALEAKDKDDDTPLCCVGNKSGSA